VIKDSVRYTVFLVGDTSMEEIKIYLSA